MKHFVHINTILNNLGFVVYLWKDENMMTILGEQGTSRFYNLLLEGWTYDDNSGTTV